MFVRDGSTFSPIIRTAFLLTLLVCAKSGMGQSPAGYSATGRVIDAVTAQPIAGAHFVYGRPATSSDNGGFVSFKIGQTNAAGEFRLQHLKPGHYSLYISSSLDRSDLYSDVLNFDVVDADVVNLEVQARHGSRLTGFVIPAGVTNATALAGLTSVKVVAAVPSIGNLRVGITNLTAISQDGSFQLTGLRPGKAFINLKADNEILNGLSILRIERNGEELKQGFEIRPGEDILDLRIMVADGTGVIRGLVKVEGGPLPAGARMTASIRNQLRFANGYASVDEEGRFVISGLAAGTYELTLNTYNSPPRQAVRLLPTMKQIVNVTDANESSVVFTVRVPNPRDAEIRRIRSAEEWPNPYVVVYSDGYELVLGHGGEAIRKARVAEIEEIVLNLPLRRWPLGRVIAVTEIGLRNPGEDLTKQREEVERMLLKHKVRVERWPSG